MKLRAVCSLLLGVLWLAPAQAPPARIQALIITGQNGHDWRATTPVLRKLLEDTGKFEVRVTDEYRGAAQETLAPYDDAGHEGFVFTVRGDSDPHRQMGRYRGSFRSAAGRFKVRLVLLG